MTYIFLIIGILLVFTVGTIIILEGVLRVWRVIYDHLFIEEVSRYDYINPEYHPYLKWHSDWKQPAFKYIPIGFRLFNTDNTALGSIAKNNKQGFRCDEFDDIPQDKIRVILLGGSSAWGCGATGNEATIAGRLEKRLEADKEFLGPFKGVKVYNMAQVNGQQSQEFLNLIFYGVHLKPHIVISYNGWNELFSHFNTVPSEIIEKFKVMPIGEMLGWKPLGVTGQKEKLLRKVVRDILLEKSVLASLILRRGRPSNEMVFERDFPKFHNLASQLYVQNLTKLKTIVEAFGGSYFTFLQPCIYTKPNLSQDELRVLELYHDVKPVAGGAAAGEWLKKGNIYSLVKQSAPDDFPLLDLNNIYRERSESIYYTLVHTNDLGYKIVADEIYSQIKISFPKGVSINAT